MNISLGSHNPPQPPSQGTRAPPTRCTLFSTKSLVSGHSVRSVAAPLMRRSTLLKGISHCEGPHRGLRVLQRPFIAGAMGRSPGSFKGPGEGGLPGV